MKLEKHQIAVCTECGGEYNRVWPSCLCGEYNPNPAVMGGVKISELDWIKIGKAKAEARAKARANASPEDLAKFRAEAEARYEAGKVESVRFKARFD